MKITFSTFVGFGSHTNFDVKVKANGKILFRHVLLVPSEKISHDNIGYEQIERFFIELSGMLHHKGYQKLSGWFDKRVKSFEDEYSSTWEHAAVLFIQELNFLVIDADPIL